jgi:hypothetical protein
LKGHQKEIAWDLSPKIEQLCDDHCWFVRGVNLIIAKLLDDRFFDFNDRGVKKLIGVQSGGTYVINN